MSGLPFVPDAATLEAAVVEHLDIIAAVRDLKTAIEALTERMDLLRANVLTAQGDALRACSAATVSGGKMDLVLKAIGDLKKLVANGHG